MSYTGPERRTDKCDLHEKNTTAIEQLTVVQAQQLASAKTWRLVGAIVGGFCATLMSVFGWVATDILQTLRTDIKDVKAIVYRGEKADDRYELELQHLNDRVSRLERAVLKEAKP